VLNYELIHSRQWFNTRSRTIGNVAYTVFVWSRLSALVELSTRYTTPDTTVEIGSTSAESRSDARENSQNGGFVP